MSNEYYVVNDQGDIVGGPFDTEEKADAWVALYSGGEGVTLITTGACDVD